MLSAHATALKVLLLNSCSLSAWPLAGVTAGALAALHTLEARGNPLQAALPPRALAACPGLRSLDLSGARGTHHHAPVVLAGAAAGGLV